MCPLPDPLKLKTQTLHLRSPPRKGLMVYPCNHQDRTLFSLITTSAFARPRNPSALKAPKPPDPHPEASRIQEAPLVIHGLRSCPIVSHRANHIAHYHISISPQILSYHKRPFESSRSRQQPPCPPGPPPQVAVSLWSSGDSGDEESEGGLQVLLKKGLCSSAV